jgi:hypothetical protein
MTPALKRALEDLRVAQEECDRYQAEERALAHRWAEVRKMLVFLAQQKAAFAEEVVKAVGKEPPLVVMVQGRAYHLTRETQLIKVEPMDVVRVEGDE